MQRNRKKEGYIAFYNLNEWFYSSFSEDEINYMEQTYQPLSISMVRTPLTTGNVSNSNTHISFFLANLLGWFYKKEYTNLCLKLALKAEETFSADNQSYIDIHFYYQSLIQFYYKLRNNKEYLEKAIYYCNKQIDISNFVAREMKNDFPSLPRHVGYEQLAMIEKKNKNWDRVIILCQKAQKEKWNGVWEKRIEEAKKHI